MIGVPARNRTHADSQGPSPALPHPPFLPCHIFRGDRIAATINMQAITMRPSVLSPKVRGFELLCPTFGWYRSRGALARKTSYLPMPGLHSPTPKSVRLLVCHFIERLRYSIHESLLLSRGL